MLKRILYAVLVFFLVLQPAFAFQGFDRWQGFESWSSSRKGYRTTFTSSPSWLSGAGEVTDGSFSGAPSFYAPTLSSGNLTVGRVYQITAQSTADFTADGAASNDLGTYFVASGTSVTLDASNTVVECSLDATNLISNGGFETAGGGGADVFAEWTESVGDGAIAQDATPHYGTYSAKLTAGATANTQINITTFNGVVGEWYVLSLLTRGDGTYGGSVYCFAPDGVGLPRTDTGVTGTSFVRKNYVFQYGNGFTIRFYCPSTTGGSAYFDDVSLRRVLPGKELLSDPDFDDAGAWTAGTGWSVADGMATRDGTTGNSNVTNTSNTYDPTGNISFCGMEILSASSGDVSPAVGQYGLLYDSIGTKTAFIPGIASIFAMRGYSFDGSVGYFSTRQLTLSSTMATTRLPGAKEVSTTPTVAGAGWAGVVVCLDDRTNPQNFVVAFIDNGDTDDLKMYKVVAGVWTSLIDEDVTYSAGAELEIRRVNDVFSVWYNGSQVGASQTITGMTGKYHGLFATGSESTFGELKIQ